eukprot:204194-Amphidinium_carterae.1
MSTVVQHIHVEVVPRMQGHPVHLHAFAAISNSCMDDVASSLAADTMRETSELDCNVVAIVSPPRPIKPAMWRPC